jgi:hypothetical protein
MKVRMSSRRVPRSIVATKTILTTKAIPTTADRPRRGARIGVDRAAAKADGNAGATARRRP